jgi:hypothetical protein
MKKIPALILTILILSLGQYCKKSNDASNTNSNNNGNNTPETTPVGTPVGTKTSQLVPKSGGTVTSADGILDLVIPDGALPTDDTITIQAITNNCPGGKGLAYRLGPDGSKFNKAVTLKFHYDDSVLKSTLPEFMAIAFQSKSGIWFLLDNANNDTVNHIISGSTNHFTDFNFIDEVEIQPSSATLKVNGELNMHATSLAVSQNTDNLGTQGYAILKGNNSTWAVNGVTNGNNTYGTIENNPVDPADNLHLNVIYKAPASAPGNNNPVLISAEFNQVFAVNSGASYGKANKAILYARVLIVDGGYHVDIKFQVEDKEYCSYYGWKDEGSFDVVFTGGTGLVKNINNSSAVIGLDSTAQGCTCSTTLQKNTIGPINIVDSSFVIINPATNKVDLIFNALDQKNYIDAPVWHFDCGPGNTGDLGGGQGPPFPGYLEFDKSDQTQTISATPFYTITVTPLK